MKSEIRLLIVDDEEIVIRSCQKVLKNGGHVLEIARSGEEAWDKYGSGNYHVVITDLKMPGMGGLELLRKIKHANPQQVVIVFTGYANVETARESLKLGAFDYIPKPFMPDELRDVVANAVKSLGSKGNAKMLDLMAIVAHEFKSPVAAVHTTAETLYGGYFGKLTPEQRQGLETVMRNCLYLEDIIRSYIDLAKMELDNLEFKKERLQFIRDVVDPVLKTPEYQANLKKMHFVTKYESDPELLGDANLLKIVINNFVNNAIKYGKASSTIRIHIFNQEDRVVFSIYNEGAGISKEDIENRLFQRFGRLKQKGTEGVKGSGLGLYICKQIVDRHEGAIEVSSEFGKYAQFNVSLPGLSRVSRSHPSCASPAPQS